METQGHSGLVSRGARAVGFLTILLLAGCAGLRPEQPEIWISDSYPWPQEVTCREAVGARPARTSWDGRIEAIWQRLLGVAEIPGRSLAWTVVMGAEEHQSPLTIAATCSNSERSTVLLWGLKLLEIADTGPNAETVLAFVLAHELAHARLHAPPRTSGRFANVAEAEAARARLLTALRPDPAREREADMLGAYWYGRAGYDCAVLRRGWARGAAEVDAQMAADCRLGQMKAIHPLLLRR